MVENQTCGSLVNVSGLCAIERDNVNEIAEISDELRRERLKNAELMERISVLEAQIQERNQESLFCYEHDSCCTAKGKSREKFKRQKMETSSDRTEDGNTENREMDSRADDRLVKWMKMDEPRLQCERFRDGDAAIECDDTDDSDDIDCYFGVDPRPANELQACAREECGEQGIDTPCILPDTQTVYDKRDLENHDRKETGKMTECTSILLHEKPSKVAFCPKEVKRIMEMDGLLLKNAEAHTLRKIVVFASLGIRHGCEDIYELDINHFSILRKGEPHVSQKNPGEHVLYNNPGVRRKVFYPNKQNPTLCPVQILEEEKAMRPSDASCPSCLFLCIKYGGRTRNLPQNEYVRQRMGRNKLKSFGQVICRMAMLVHIRSGSFFFKALGITLLFMAGFPDNLVQRETKYRNLGLLQKYYRTDEDAEGEDLFLPHPVTCDTQAQAQQLAGKTKSTKRKGNKQANAGHKPQNAQRSMIQQAQPSSSLPSDKFGLMGYTSVEARSMAPFQSVPSQTPADIIQITNTAIPYQMFPPQPANAFMPLVYWPPPNTFPPCPYPSAYGYQSFPFTGHYTAFHRPPDYTHPSSNCIIPKRVECTGKNDGATEEADSDSDSSSSISVPKETVPSCKQPTVKNSS